MGSSGVSYVSVGGRSLPLMNSIPIARVLPPLLHLLLGLRNDMHSSFKNFIAMRIEKSQRKK